MHAHLEWEDHPERSDRETREGSYGESGKPLDSGW